MIHITLRFRETRRNSAESHAELLECKADRKDLRQRIDALEARLDAARREALTLAKRTDLIGWGPKCLVPPDEAAAPPPAPKGPQPRVRGPAARPAPKGPTNAPRPTRKPTQTPARTGR